MAVYRSVRAKGNIKTRKSRRVLKLPKRAVEALREHRKRQAAERLQACEKWQDHDLVGHSGTSVTESVYGEIRPALTTGATAMNKILSKKRPRTA